MKKILSLFTGALTVFSCAPLLAYAEDTPADLPVAVYEQLKENVSIDKNKDGIISEEEYCNAGYLILNLDGLDSLDFLKRLKNPTNLTLSGGNFSDLSFLADFKELKYLYLDNMPDLTDISFAKDMELSTFDISGLEQITDEQKLEIMKFYDADTSVGVPKMIGFTPAGMFKKDELSLVIDDESFLGSEPVNISPSNRSHAVIYGKSAGSTEYSVMLKDKEIYRGRINISEPDTFDLPLNTEKSEPQVFSSSYYSKADMVILNDSTLYRLNEGRMEMIAENVADFDNDNTYDENGEFISTETILYKDGTAEVNGEKLASPDGKKFKAIGRGMCVTEDGNVYSLHQVGGKLVPELIYQGFSSFLEHSSLSFISDKNEVIQIELKKETRDNESIAVGYQAFETGIKNITSSYNDFYIDKDKTLWMVKRNVGSKPDIKLCAKDVDYVGYRWYSDNKVYGCVHITSDGTAYMAGSSVRVTLSSEQQKDYKEMGYFYTNFSPGIKGIQYSGYFNYYLTNDDLLCLNYKGDTAAFSNVDRILTERQDNDNDSVYVYFMATDGTIWSYRFGTGEIINASENSVLQTHVLIPKEKISGDVNGDNAFDVSDAVLLQKWLLAVPDTKLKVPEAADMCKDGNIDVFDICVMKKELLKKTDKTEPQSNNAA